MESAASTFASTMEQAEGDPVVPLEKDPSGETQNMPRHHSLKKKNTEKSLDSNVSEAVYAADHINASHLLVLFHGLIGGVDDLRHFERLFKEQSQLQDVYVHNAKSNASSFFATFDGIDTGAERLADEIQEIAKKMPNLTKFSLVGHSLGGLYGRYCIGILLHRGFFDKITPMNFITLATPHLGIRRPHRGINILYNSVMPSLFSLTGRQFTLTDTASERTMELSCTTDIDSTKELHPGPFDINSICYKWMEMQGLLLVRIHTSLKESQSDAAPFRKHFCVLKNHKVDLYELGENEDEITPEEVANQPSKLQIDLLCADVLVALPDRSGKSSKKHLFGFLRRHSELEQTESTPPESVDVYVRWTSSPSKCESETKSVQHACVFHIPEDELAQRWKWLVALSNNALGVECRTKTGEKGEFLSPRELNTKSPPLLNCLARGKFLQALMMFRARTLYSNVFYDMQVPFTGAAIRAFNPYRQESARYVTSPFYRHILVNSLWSAKMLRDTVPLAVKRLALRYASSTYLAVNKKGRHHLRRLKGQTTVNEDGIIANDSMISTSTHSSEHSESENRSVFSTPVTTERRHQSVDSSFIISSSALPSFESNGTRPEPFVEGLVTLDRLPEAFTSDTESDTLRGMLLALQSVGWRRIDVIFENILAHEHIIAKRANLSKPMDSGIDVVHHIMDTFFL